MSADLLTRLLEAGTPAALVAEVAMLAARADADRAAIEGRRERDRSRQTSRRHAMSRDITLDSVTTRDTADEPAPSPPPLSSPQTPQQTPPPHPHPDRLDAPVCEARGAPAGRTAKRRWPKTMPPPAGVVDEQWLGFLAHRLAKRQPLTPRAYDLLCQKLAGLAEAGWPPGEMIDRAVERGWITVFAPNEHHNGNRPHLDDRSGGWAPRPGMAGVEPASLDDDDHRLPPRG